MLYPPNHNYEAFVISDILNTILVMRGARKAYLPQSKEISHALVHYFNPFVKTLSTPLIPELLFVVSAGSRHPSPTTDIEVGHLLGYPCAEDWDRSYSTLFYDIVAIMHSGEEVILFSFKCKTEEKVREARALSGIISVSLLSDPFARKYVKASILRKGTVNETGQITYTDISKPTL